MGSTEGVSEWNRALTNEPLGLQGSRFKVLMNEPLNKGAASPDTLAHEMAHIAQRLGNKQAPELYNLAGRGLESDALLRGDIPSTAANVGYLANPFERSARAISMRKVHGIERRVPVAEAMESELKAAPNNPHLRNAVHIMQERRTGQTRLKPNDPFTVSKTSRNPQSRQSVEGLKSLEADWGKRGNFDRVTSPEDLPNVVATSNVTPETRPPYSYKNNALLTRRTSGHKGSGEYHGRAKLNPDLVRDIRARAAAGQRITDIHKDYSDLSPESISAVIKRDTWGWVKD